MLDFIGTIVLVAAIIVSINALTGAMPIGTSQRLALSVGAGLWTGLAAALASANLFLGTNPVGPPTIGTMIALPLVADGRCGVDLAVGACFAARNADAVPDRPERLAPGGRIFLLLAAEGRLAGPFPDLGGLGRCHNRRAGLARGLGSRCAGKAGRWSGPGMHSACSISWPRLHSELSPQMARRCRLFTPGKAPEAVQVLPWSLIPTVLVPIYLIVHGIIFAKLAEISQRVPS